MADFFWFSDDQWTRIEPLLPVNGKGARRVDDRRVLSGIVRGKGTSTSYAFDPVSRLTTTTQDLAGTATIRPSA